MIKQKNTIFVLVMILFTMQFFLNVNVFSGESVIPPPPDKNKTLTANDGGSDGCNSSRFKCVMGGEAVLDNQTGLTWARNADIANGAKPWKEAVEFCQNLEIGNRKGWRLPTKEEFINILDTSQSYPVLPDGHPFKNLKKSRSTTSGWNDTWTGTTSEDNSDEAYYIAVGNGMVMDELKVFDFFVWPVLNGK